MKKLLFLLLLLSNSAYGAVVIRYFATAAAGAGDGTTHANRAALFDGSNNWSTVITGFSFAGTDSMEARLETGSYTCAQTLATGLFANPPTATNPLTLVGADSSGNVLPAPSWKSCQPAWDTSTMPTINTTTNIRTININTLGMYMINLTSSGSTGGSVVNAAGNMEWCQVVNSAAGATVSALSGASAVNCALKCSGSQYSVIITGSTATNCRIEGTLSASSGTRRGFSQAGTTTVTIVGCTIINNVGGGIYNTGTGTISGLNMANCVIAANGADGIQANSTAAQTAWWQVFNSMITGNTGWGINGNTNSHWALYQVRLRDNTSGDITAVGNSPVDLNVTTTAGSDAAEYVNVAGGDFTIKSSSIYWGKGYGVADQITANSSGFLIQ